MFRLSNINESDMIFSIQKSFVVGERQFCIGNVKMSSHPRRPLLSYETLVHAIAGATVRQFS